jgi:hypothetical protein
MSNVHYKQRNVLLIYELVTKHEAICCMALVVRFFPTVITACIVQVHVYTVCEKVCWC